LEATIDAKGNIKLREPVALRGKKRALVTILDDDFDEEVVNETALLSEASLAKEWLMPEEDAAWAHLADLPDLDARSRSRNGKKGQK